MANLGLVGKMSGGDSDGVILRMLKDYNTMINPEDYFVIFDGRDGLTIRLKHALDRDVSRACRMANSVRCFDKNFGLCTS